MNPYEKYLELLLPLAGFALQWMRQHSHIPESRTGIAALGTAVAVYILCLDWAALPQGVAAVQAQLLDALVWLGIAVPAVLGGTFTASKLAAAGVPGIPPTNSK